VNAPARVRFQGLLGLTVGLGLLLGGCGAGAPGGEVVDATGAGPDVDADAERPGDGGDGIGGDATEPVVTGPRAVFDPGAGADFYRAPWPSDARRLPGGQPALADFPGPRPPWVDAAVGVVEREVVGFAAMPVVYVPFRELAGPPALPSPSGSLDDAASVQLLAVGPGSCGRRVPIRARFDAEGTASRAAEVLMATPVPGFPLEPGATYALVVLASFGGEAGAVAPAPAVREALAGADPSGAEAAALAPLRACLPAAGLDAEAILTATVFTVQDARAELVQVRDAVADPARTPGPQVRGWTHDAGASDPPRQQTFVGRYETPIYQGGETPYAEGGGFVLSAAGEPTIQRWEEVPFALSVPGGEPPPGTPGWPVLIWMDGTGAGLLHHLGGAPTRDALAAGFAVATFAPQFHGERAVPGSDPVLSGFNFLNGEAGRTVFRQQAVDTSYFIRVLREALPDARGEDGAAPPALDTTSLVYAGQSQGALVGAMLAGVEPELGAYALNGTGAYVAATVVERKDPFDVAALLQVLSGVNEPIDVFHPVVQLVQLATEPVDVHTYARAWAGWEGHPDGSHVFLISGDQDPTTPRVLIDHLTIAGDLAPIAPPGWDVDPYGVWHREPAAPPIAGNRLAVSGRPLTMASFLAAGEGHFTIYRRADARAQALTFLESARSGVATIPAPD